jgi:hypothetical protein
MASWAFKYDIIQREYNTQDMTSWAFKYDIIQREYNNEMFYCTYVLVFKAKQNPFLCILEEVKLKLRYQKGGSRGHLPIVYRVNLEFKNSIIMHT